MQIVWKLMQNCYIQELLHNLYSGNAALVKRLAQLAQQSSTFVL